MHDGIRYFVGLPACVPGRSKINNTSPIPHNYIIFCWENKLRQNSKISINPQKKVVPAHFDARIEHIQPWDSTITSSSLGTVSQRCSRFSGTRFGKAVDN